MGGKQVLAQGVAKAIVSGASGISGQQAAAKAAGGSGGKSGGQSSHIRFLLLSSHVFSSINIFF